MGTEVIRPQDCLVDRFVVRHASFNSRRNRRRNISCHGNPKNLGTHQKQNNNKENRKPFPKHVRKKRYNPKAVNSKKSRDDAGVSDSRRREEIDPVKGQVKLLGRAESLDSLDARIKDDGNQQIHKSENQISAIDGTVPESPPEMVPKKIRVEAIETYAGAGFFLSPSPRALPLPSFLSTTRRWLKTMGE